MKNIYEVSKLREALWEPGRRSPADEGIDAAKEEQPMRDAQDAWTRARNAAIANARRILTTLEASPQVAKNWADVGTMQRWDAELHHISDAMHNEGEYAKG